MKQRVLNNVVDGMQLSIGEEAIELPPIPP